MHQGPLTPKEKKALKARILRFKDPSTEAIVDLIPSPVEEVVNCRVQTTSLHLVKALMEHYSAIYAGKSLYFCMPRNNTKARKRETVKLRKRKQQKPQHQKLDSMR